MNTKTIDEKAKAYDEAIKRIENIKTGKCETTFMFTEGLFEYIFPELKESEDERIMGNIIATIHLYYGEPLEDEAKEMVAWLEKHSQTFTKKDVDDAYLKGVCDAKHELEKQGKNNMGISEATKQKLENNVNKALEKETPESWNEFLDEQNSSWSEEDEKSVNIILDICSDFKKVYSYSKTVLKDADKIESFLKSLKNRVQPQPKQEWNEDTQQWIDAIIKDYEGRYDADKDHRATIQVKINILKSLRPQSTWKPSDGQIDAVRDAIDYLGCNTKKVRENLMSLYEQLKKLRED